MIRKMIQISVLGSLALLLNCSSDLNLVGTSVKATDLQAKIFENKRGGIEYAYGNGVLKIKDPHNYELLVVKVAVKNATAQSVKLNFFTSELHFENVDPAKPKDKAKPGVTIQGKVLYASFGAGMAGIFKDIADANSVYIVELAPESEVEREIVFSVPKTAKLKAIVLGNNGKFSIPL